MIFFPLSAEEHLQEMLGPSTREQWVYWRSRTTDQKNRNTTKNELDKLLLADEVRTPTPFNPLMLKRSS